jgi:AAA15 family ATPase/GTPase
MINKIHIQNFKSINDLELDVGRVNLFIGENGSGKSNLLEALVFASASDSNKLDKEFLVSRGLRVSESTFMRNAFENKSENENIKITINSDNDKSKLYELTNENDSYSSWERLHDLPMGSLINEINSNSKKLKYIQNLLKDDITTEEKEKFIITLEEISKKNEFMANQLNIQLNNFIIYSPENTALRNFYKEGQIEPLGINGEGLLKLIKVVNSYEDQSYIDTIKESLKLFNWFESINIPKDLSSNEDKIIIKDKFLYKEFDQRSANEGFLFILFYITLVVAKQTPKAFAIDNIDASLNPKLCTKLILLLTELATKYDKQIFLTTHNPAILDGIDLNDDEQKLFVMSRNKSGHTRAKQITVKDKPKSSDDTPIKLSEAFLRGYLGGLPKGF